MSTTTLHKYTLVKHVFYPERLVLVDQTTMKRINFVSTNADIDVYWNQYIARQSIHRALSITQFRAFMNEYIDVCECVDRQFLFLAYFMDFFGVSLCTKNVIQNQNII